MRTRLVMIPIIGGALLLTGCGSLPAITARPSPSTTATATSTPVSPIPVWDAAAERAASATAQIAATQFITTTGGYEAWWAGYKPLLTARYAKEAAFIDPERIPVTSWSGMTVVNPDHNPVAASVEFTGDDGLWLMRLERGGHGQWLVSSFTKKP